MKKIFILAVTVSIVCFFNSCKNQNTPEAAVEKYYNCIINGEYRESIALIDFGEPAIEDEKIDKIVEDMEKEFSDNSAITKYEILSTKKKSKDGFDYAVINTKYYTKEEPNGIEQDFTLYKNAEGEWKFTFAK